MAIFDGWFKPGLGRSPHEADWARLRMAVRGDAGASARIVQALTPGAYRLAMRILNHPQDAEDVLQEAFVRLWRAAEKAGAQASVATYFNTIVINRCKTCLSRRDLLRHAVEFDETSSDGLLAGVGPDEPAGDIFETDRLAKALTELPQRQRIALSLWAYEDYTPADIARVLDIPENAVHQLLFRSKQNLRKRLTGLRHGI